MASGVPFIIVRGETKEYGTANRIEGPYGSGELVCLVEDVVTSGGALARGGVGRSRDAGLVVRHALCVVDREEGGADALAGSACGCTRSTRASELLAGGTAAENRMVEPNHGARLGSPRGPSMTSTIRRRRM